MSKQEKLITFAYQKRKKGELKIKNEGVTSSTSKTNEEDELKMLKDFDLYCEFGPCIGITRLERWERAEKHGLNPSAEIRNMILGHSDDNRYTECLWKEYQTLI